ncbi:MFS transporter [Streptomyces sp. NPDC093707]|uniref:MFS transporter n=1 Tax=Streptomyces sp. NPDC093707 TaxID=3154984 RepID=UPI00344DAC9B
MSRGPGRVLAGRFLQFWLIQLCAQVGAKVALLFLPLLAIRGYGVSPAVLGFLNALQYFPVLAVALLFGAAFDRWNRRTCFVAAYLGNSAALLLVPLYGDGRHRVLLLVGVCTAMGCLVAFADMCAQTVPPDLVPADQLVAANGRLEFVYSLCLVGAPGAAGLLYDRFGSGPGLTVVSALCCAAGVLSLGLRLSRRAGPEPGARPRVWAATVSGMRFLLRHPVLRVTTVQAGLFNFLEQAVMTVYLLLAVRLWGLSPGSVGMTITVGGAGTVLGAVVAAGRGGRMSAVRALVLGMGLASLTPMLLVFAGGSRPILITMASATFMIYGFGLTLYNVHAVSLRQMLTPPERLGSVSAAYRFLAFGPIGLGALLGGWAGGFLGLRASLTVFVALLAVAFAVFAVSALRLRATIAAVLPEGRGTGPDGVANDSAEPVRTSPANPS